MVKIYLLQRETQRGKEFANALKYNMRSKDGYLESEEAIVTWCGTSGDHELSGRCTMRNLRDGALDTSFSPGGIQIRSH